jgi:coenzyme F390 synthetase
MNVGANTMTLAAREIGMTIIPMGRCTFPSRVIKNYKPTGIVGSVFKLLGLARQLKNENIPPQESSIQRLVVGGESFAEESRAYLAEIWGCEVYNTYGSTEGTMCSECTDKSGLHVTEDLVHLDIYDPQLKNFVKDGDCGRIVLTTLLAVGEKCGTLLLNYDTEDTTTVVTRERCACGRTHMKILNPQRESETFWVAETPFNRVDVEGGVFQRENMEYLTGEYEAFLYGGDEEEETIMRVSVECLNRETCDRKAVEENFLRAFFKYKPFLEKAHADGILKIIFNFAAPGDLELYRIKGRPKRIVDRR